MLWSGFRFNCAAELCRLVEEFSGFFHGSSLHCDGFFFVPDASEGVLNLFLKAGDQIAVGGYQRPFGFDLGDDGFLRRERG
jgi:hypothetical protein